MPSQYQLSIRSHGSNYDRQETKGALPPNTPVAHKTGTTDTIKGLNGATNDVGVILPRTVDQIAIAVYIKGSTRDEEIRDP
ncbi:MAG: serine hydrolase [Bryobacteraceae bacterium]